MTSPRELILKTLDFESPERITRQMWLLPWATTRYPDQIAHIQRLYPDDIVYAPGYYKISLPTKG